LGKKCERKNISGHNQNAKAKEILTNISGNIAKMHRSREFEHQGQSRS
jgi:hypothetical protein